MTALLSPDEQFARAVKLAAAARRHRARALELGRIHGRGGVRKRSEEMIAQRCEYLLRLMADDLMREAQRLAWWDTESNVYTEPPAP